jgi:hypothetical protein
MKNASVSDALDSSSQSVPAQKLLAEIRPCPLTARRDISQATFSSGCPIDLKPGCLAVARQPLARAVAAMCPPSLISPGGSDGAADLNRENHSASLGGIALARPPREQTCLGYGGN